MLAFARWRLERRGLHADVIDLTVEPLPDAGFDLATAIDVLEHLADPGREIARMGRALRPGGLLVYNDCTGLDPERPMHIVPSLYPILRSLRRSGFRETTVPAGLAAYAYRVAVMPAAAAVSNHAWGVYDDIRYGVPGRLASAMLRRWRRSRAAR
jgi:SAM-dependent methyltransferase